MRENEVQASLRRQLGLRVGRQMAEHLARQAQRLDGHGAGVSIIGADARTGAPVHAELKPEALRLLLRGPGDPNA